MGPIIEGQSEEVPDERDGAERRDPDDEAGPAEPGSRGCHAARPQGCGEDRGAPAHRGAVEGWVDKLRQACAVLYSRQEVVEIGERASVTDAIATGPGWVRAEVSKILAENYARFGEEPEAEEPPEAGDPRRGQASAADAWTVKRKPPSRGDGLLPS